MKLLTLPQFCLGLLFPYLELNNARALRVVHRDLNSAGKLKLAQNINWEYKIWIWEKLVGNNE